MFFLLVRAYYEKSWNENVSYSTGDTGEGKALQINHWKIKLRIFEHSMFDMRSYNDNNKKS